MIGFHHRSRDKVVSKSTNIQRTPEDSRGERFILWSGVVGLWVTGVSRT